MSDLEISLTEYFGIDAHFGAQIASLFVSETLPKNSFHTQLGTRYVQLSFIQSGYLRIYRQTDKKEVTQWISAPGEFTTDLNAIMFDQPARWNIQALTECTLLSLDFNNYKRMGDLIPEWPKIEKLFLSKCFITIEDRVFSFLSLNAEERYRLLHETRRELFQHIPQQYLASMLGMTPETFSRIRAKVIS